MEEPKTPELLYTAQGLRPLSARETLKRAQRFFEQCPGMAAIIIIAPVGDTKSIACTHTRNLPRGAVREMVRNAHVSIDNQGDLPSPG